MPENRYTNILFDEDGTLTDSKIGILRCFEYALDQMNISAPTQAALTLCIGPPLRDSFAKLLNTNDHILIEAALTHFRDRYASVGLFESSAYPGAADMLAHLKSTGHRLFVVTSNATLYAKEIMAHFLLDIYFDEVYGPTLDGAHDNKADLIKFVVAQQMLDPTDTLMVGDRFYDISAAQNNGIDGLGVIYGYGSSAELLGAGAIALCDSEASVANWILSTD